MTITGLISVKGQVVIADIYNYVHSFYVSFVFSNPFRWSGSLPGGMTQIFILKGLGHY